MKANAPRLTVELVPRGSWNQNLRAVLTIAEWRRVQRKCFAKAKTHCEVCGTNGTMHCHEKWEYNDARHVQKLTGTVCLCERCHGVKHYGFSAVQGRGDEMRHHLAVVNGWDTRKTVAYLQACFGVWAQRCLHEWTVDMSWLEANK